VRIGDALQQVRYDPHKPVRFAPSACEKRQFARIDLFKRIGTAEVELPPLGQAALRDGVKVQCFDASFNGARLRVTVTPNGEVDASLDSQQPQAEEPATRPVTADNVNASPRSGMNDSQRPTTSDSQRPATSGSQRSKGGGAARAQQKVIMAKQYLVDHRVEDILQKAVKVLLSEQPGDAMSFLSAYLAGKATSSSEVNLASKEAATGALSQEKEHFPKPPSSPPQNKNSKQRPVPGRNSTDKKVESQASGAPQVSTKPVKTQGTQLDKGLQEAQQASKKYLSETYEAVVSSPRAAAADEEARIVSTRRFLSEVFEGAYKNYGERQEIPGVTEARKEIARDLIQLAIEDVSECMEEEIRYVKELTSRPCASICETDGQTTYDALLARRSTRKSEFQGLSPSLSKDLTEKLETT